LERNDTLLLKATTDPSVITAALAEGCAPYAEKPDPGGAARAGPAGRGFAVVVQEVESLAAQTTQALADINRQTQSVLQTDAGGFIGQVKAA
jgi:hypothetical protein